MGVFWGGVGDTCSFRNNGLSKDHMTKRRQALCALVLGCIVEAEFSRWRRRSRNFEDYMLYISIDIVLSDKIFHNSMLTYTCLRRLFL